MTPDGTENSVVMSITIPESACCLGCRYSLKGLNDPRCPECGRAFDPGNLRTMYPWGRATFLIGHAVMSFIQNLAKPIGLIWLLVWAISAAFLVLSNIAWIDLDPNSLFALPYRSQHSYRAPVLVFVAIVVAIMARDGARRIAIWRWKISDTRPGVHARRMRLLRWGTILFVLIICLGLPRWGLFLIRHRAWQNTAEQLVTDNGEPIPMHARVCPHGVTFLYGGWNPLFGPQGFYYVTQAPLPETEHRRDPRLHLWGKWFLLMPDYRM